MKLIFDKHKLAEKKHYDERYLDECICGCGRRFPSKRMFIEFLKHYKDVDGEANIWSKKDLNTGKETIYVELSFMPSDFTPSDM